MRGNLLSDRLFKRVNATVKRSERAYRNTRDHRRRNVTRGGTSPLKIGVLQTALDYGSGASVVFYTGTPGSEAPDGAGSQTCYPWMLKTGDTIPASSEVVCAKINGYWYVIQAQCPSSS